MHRLSPLLCLAVAGAARAQTIPPMPSPAAPTFAQERAGRQLWLAGRDRVRAGGLRFVCRWESFRGTARDRAGVEIVAADPDRERLDWILETSAPQRQVRRIVLADDRLLTLRFDAAPAPKRTFTLAPPRADWKRVGLRGTEPVGVGARWAVQPSPAPDTRLWRADDGTLWETPYSRTDAASLWVRRYRLDPKSRALAQVEEWTREASAGRRRTTAATTLYRRETYSPTVARADLFSQKLPEGYVEEPGAGEAQGGAEIEPAAARLLDRWRDAFERPLALQATIGYETTFEKRTPTSRDYNRRNDSGAITVWLRRPGRARAATVVVNGDRAMGRRPVDVRDTESIWTRLRRTGVDDQTFLSYFFDGPPDLSEYQRVRSLGRSTLDDGTEVDVIEATRTETQTPRGDRRQETETTLLIGIAGGGLPREIQQRIKTTIADLTDTNQPPIVVRRVRWTNVAHDNDVSPERFAVR